MGGSMTGDRAKADPGSSKVPPGSVTPNGLPPASDKAGGRDDEISKRSMADLARRLAERAAQQRAVDLAGLRSCPVLLVAPDCAFGHAPRHAVDRPWIEAKRSQSRLDLPHVVTPSGASLGVAATGAGCLSAARVAEAASTVGE